MERFDISAVVHFAASIVVEESVRRPLDYYRNNVLATCELLSACVAAGVDRIVFSSTAAIYASSGQAPIVEATPTNPASPYGATKRAASA